MQSANPDFQIGPGKRLGEQGSIYYLTLDKDALSIYFAM
jgi:hypothetical protein